MIKPVNGHLLIEPLVHDGFMASQSETYQEIGVVVDVPNHINHIEDPDVQIGDKVYFDSWLAAKYPKSDTEFYWLVKWEDVRAIEVKNETISE